MNCEMPQHSHGDSTWGRLLAKSCKIDIESHVNEHFVVPGTMGFPCRPKGGGGFSGFPGLICMEFPCKELARNGSPSRAHRYLYMEFPCKERGAPGLQVPLHGIPMSERGRRTDFHGNSHVNISLVFFYMADPMQMKWQASRKPSESFQETFPQN